MSWSIPSKEEAEEFTRSYLAAQEAYYEKHKKDGEVRMMLQVEIQDLRRMLKEKCEEIISDKKLAYEFYWRICEIEEDDRFTIVDDLQKGR